MQIARHPYPVTVYTHTHKVEGVYQAIGRFMTALNDPDGTCFAMEEATFTPLASHAALRTVSVPQVVVSKGDILFISFPDDTVQNDVQMFKRVATVVAYTSSFALRGDFHLGVEDDIQSIFDTLKGTFQPLTEAMIYPLIETQVSVPREQDLIVVNTRAIQLYHPDTSA